MNIISFFVTSLLFYTSIFASENPRFYLGKNHHHVDWANIETKTYLNYDIFIDELKKSHGNPDYDREHRDLNNFERAALVLSCVNECELLKGKSKNKVRYLSSIREGDEVLTVENSYLWLFMLDGTMVRLSPHTSLTINEVNLGKKKNVLFVRLNYGNLLWLGRDSQLLKVNDKRETDRLFLPLKLREANKLSTESSDDHFKRLNDSVKKNNTMLNKKTQTFLVMPNGSVSGDSLSGEFISLFNGKSYFKMREFEELGLMSKRKSIGDVNFYFRGHNNTNVKSIDIGKWYEVSENGDKVSEALEGKFGLGEFLTKNIPTILLAREKMIEQYSFPLFSTLSKKSMGEKLGYRVWTEKELEKRLSFVESYTRRLETTQLKVLKEFWEKQKEIKTDIYDGKYYSYAMSAYATETTRASQHKKKKVLLNSEKKAFWKVINEK